jgi:hypothetical protein
MTNAFHTLPEKKLDGWKGTFELYQDERFARIVAKHYGLQVLSLDGLLVLARKSPLLGYTRAVIGSPEIKKPLVRFRGWSTASDLRRSISILHPRTLLWTAILFHRMTM